MSVTRQIVSQGTKKMIDGVREERRGGGGGLKAATKCECKAVNQKTEYICIHIFEFEEREHREVGRSKNGMSKNRQYLKVE